MFIRSQGCRWGIGVHFIKCCSAETRTLCVILLVRVIVFLIRSEVKEVWVLLSAQCLFFALLSFLAFPASLEILSIPRWKSVCECTHIRKNSVVQCFDSKPQKYYHCLI